MTDPAHKEDTQVATLPVHNSLGAYIRELRAQDHGMREYSEVSTVEALRAKQALMSSLLDDVEEGLMTPSDKISFLRIVNVQIKEDQTRADTGKAFSHIVRLIKEGKIKVDMSASTRPEAIPVHSEPVRVDELQSLPAFKDPLE